jgi:ArsR family transcriptional regulator, arsenate/arsenite/antimonite-responsive transcriptional repressor
MRLSKSHEFSQSQQDLALYAKILSHPARIAIIQLLAEKKEIKTGNISDFLPISRTTVSQHLKFLKENGIICGTIDGLRIHYCLDIEKLKEMNSSFRKLLENSITTFKCNCEE